MAHLADLFVRWTIKIICNSMSWCFLFLRNIAIRYEKIMTRLLRVSLQWRRADDIIWKHVFFAFNRDCFHFNKINCNRMSCFFLFLRKREILYEKIKTRLLIINKGTHWLYVSSLPTSIVNPYGKYTDSQKKRILNILNFQGV